MRERLIALVNKAKEEYANDVTDHTETEYIVECLMDNRVLVLPEQSDLCSYRPPSTEGLLKMIGEYENIDDGKVITYEDLEKALEEWDKEKKNGKNINQKQC